jgi:F-type H+-transporting ATPase subunit b
MDASFWALVGLILFLVLITYLKVPGMITGALDKRAERISTELEEARKLREEAQAVLAEYQRKQRAAEEEAETIVAQAKDSAEAMAQDAKQQLEDWIARRTKMAEDKIAQAEAQALQEVRGISADVAIAAAEKLLTGKMTAGEADKAVSSSIDEIKARLQ